MAEALKKRQEMADLQRQKMEEERKKQIEFMKASKESMSMTELSNFTSVFVYSRMCLFVCMCESLIGSLFLLLLWLFPAVVVCVCVCLHMCCFVSYCRSGYAERCTLVHAGYRRLHF